MAADFHRALAAAFVLAATLGGSPVRAETPAETFAAAESLFQRGAYEEALASYRDFTARFPADWRATQARFTAGFILQKKLSRPAQAREAYESVVTCNAASPLARHAEFHIAEAYEQDGDMQKAIREYRLLLKKAAKHDRAPGVNRKLDFLDRMARGQKPEPPGWAGKIERRSWRKSQGQRQDPGEKRPRVKAVPGRNAKHRGTGPDAAQDPPAPPPEREAQEPKAKQP